MVGCDQGKWLMCGLRAVILVDSAGKSRRRVLCGTRANCASFSYTWLSLALHWVVHKIIAPSSDEELNLILKFVFQKTKLFR